MRVIDLHCDSLYKAVTQNIGLDSNSLDVKLDLKKNDKRLQCYAIWLPDNLSGNEAEKMFLYAAMLLKSECKRCNIELIQNGEDIVGCFKNHYSALFTVENGSALNGKIENVKLFADMGVKMITLTWNCKNQIGDGAEVKAPKGITEFGKSAVAEMEKDNIIVDVSHASEKLFYDVAEIAKRPFVASHSNSKAVTDHNRNLTDEQFKIIANNGGIVGINFHKAFLADDPEKANKFDILKHIDRFLSLGGENNVCLGSDFDGCDLPNDINDSRFFDELYEIMLKGNYKESLINKIFYDNALKFFESFDNQRIM